MGENALAVEIRTQTGKGVARKLRAAGRIPAVLYGHGNDPQSLTLDPIELEAIIKNSEAGMNTLIDLAGASSVAGKVVLVKEMQREPVRAAMLHVDLYEVDVTQTVQVSVPVHITGTAVGVSLGGGLLDHTLREIEVDCLPRAIPDELVVDVSSLDLGESLHVRDVPLPGGVELRTDGDLAVVSVAAPAVEEEAAPTEEEAEVAAAAEEGAAPAEAPAKSDGD